MLPASAGERRRRRGRRHGPSLPGAARRDDVEVDVLLHCRPRLDGQRHRRRHVSTVSAQRLPSVHTVERRKLGAELRLPDVNRVREIGPARIGIHEIHETHEIPINLLNPRA